MSIKNIKDNHKLNNLINSYEEKKELYNTLDESAKQTKKRVAQEYLSCINNLVLVASGFATSEELEIIDNEKKSLEAELETLN